MKQIPLIHAGIAGIDEYKPLCDLVEFLGGAQKVAVRLCPEKYEKKPDDGGKWVSNCLDPKRDQKFSWHDILRMLCAARVLGYHNCKHFIDSYTGYHASTPKSLEEEERDLLLEVREYQDEITARVTRITDLRKQQKGEW